MYVRRLRKIAISTKEIGKKLNELIQDASDYDSWVKPDDSALRQEYNVEYKFHIKHQYGNIWPTFEDFKKSVDEGQITTLTKDMDYDISNRSQTDNMQELVSLVSSYRSWPEFRNESTLSDAINRFINNQPMTMPIILDDNGDKQIMSGNTRLDQAFMMKVKPQVVIIKVPTANKEEFEEEDF